MYTHDGKPVVPPMGRRNTEVNRFEFEKLMQRVDKLEALLMKEPVEQIEDIDALKNEAAELGIEVKGNWGAKRIKKAIEDAKAE